MSYDELPARKAPRLQMLWTRMTGNSESAVPFAMTHSMLRWLRPCR